jgi:hypothetical protein
MFDSEILETVIGLAFVYLLLSLTCSAITEFFARLFNMRGATLKEAIRQMVYGSLTGVTWGFQRTSSLPEPRSETTNGANPKPALQTVEDFYAHGLIRPLFDTAYRWWVRSPSYIDPRTFALVLVDKVLDYGSGSTEQKKAQAEAGSQVPGNAEKESGQTTIQDIVDALPQDSPLTERLQHVLKHRELPSTQELDLQMHDQFMQLDSAVKALTTVSPELKQLQSALIPLLTAAKSQSASWEEAYDKTLAEIERWFDSTMKRVTGWYARQARTITFVIALLITLAFNVDSLAIARSLYTNTTQRQAIVAAATAYVQNAQSSTTQGEQPAQGGTPIPQPSLDELLAQIRGLDVPIGWVVPDNSNGAATIGKPDPSQIYPISSAQLPEKAAGLALTVIMLSLGAPFWFDMLNKLVNLRASGAKPEPADKKS